jgi:hypothetical protein
VSHPIHAAAKPYLDGTWKYPSSAKVGRRVAYPWPKGVRGPAVADSPAERQIDCSTLTASLLMRAYPDAPWVQTDYAGLQIMDATEPDSPITVAVQAIGAGRVDFGVGLGGLAPESWFLCQGWRRLPGDPAGASGHAVILYNRGNGLLDVLESTSRESFRGPRWRMTTAYKLREEFPAALYVARLA